MLAIGYHGTHISGADRHALAFIQEHSSDMAGPLFGRIREELGLAPTDLDVTGQIVLAVVRRGEVHRFDQSGVTILEQGDRLVVIRSGEAHSGQSGR